MNKMPSESMQNPEDELLDEYRFDYQKAKPNRFAARNQTQNLTIVVLDEDVAQVFTTPESVNNVNSSTRALLEAPYIREGQSCNSSMAS